MAINAFAQYQQNQYTTASPGGLIVMAYDGAIKFTRIAAEKMKAGDLYLQNEYLKKAQAIIVELASTLNPEPNPELASNLFNIYEYLLKRLAEANVNSDEKPLVEAVQLMTDLRMAWAEVVNGTQVIAAEVA